MDALEELEQMHQEARTAFSTIESSRPADRAGLWAKLDADLKLHEQIEERFVYDPVVHDLQGNQQLDQFHQQHELEASQASHMIDRLGSLNPTDGEWLTQLQELHTMMERHMEEEERQFWPLIRETWGEKKLEDAGRAVGASKAAGKVTAAMAGAMGKVEQAVKG